MARIKGTIYVKTNLINNTVIVHLFIITYQKKFNLF